MHSMAPLLGGKKSSEAKSLKGKTLECTSLNHHLGIEASPVTPDLLEWVAKIKGIEDTFWEGNHDKRPPYVVFNTVPFHPNVDKDTGEVCISFPHSRNEWDLNTSAVSILRFIQHVLSHPDLEDPVNLEAAEMFLNRPNAYREVVEQCVKTSQALEREDMGVTEANPGKPLRSDRVVRRISFEEYLQAWTATATTKAGPLMANESLDKLVSSAQMLAHRCGSPTHVVVPFSEASFKTIRDGLAQTHQREKRQKEVKLVRIQQMRKLYQRYSKAEPQQECPAAPQATAPCPGRRVHWETEVDSLVAWTHTLSLEELEDDH